MVGGDSGPRDSLPSLITYSITITAR